MTDASRKLKTILDDGHVPGNYDNKIIIMNVTTYTHLTHL